MSAVIYTRFSSDRQNESSNEAQDRLCRQRAEALGVAVTATHADSAISGAVPVEGRPGGRALLAGALAARFTVLLVEGLDRLSRDIGEQDRVVKRLEHRGIRIIGVSDGYDTQLKSRKVMRVARGLVNELYLDDLRDKVHRTLSAKAARGGHVAGLSFGYRSVQAGDDRRLEVVPEHAAIVREIFSRYASGETLKPIVCDLNARGIVGPRGHKWAVTALYGSPHKLAGILNNPLYIGEYHWNRSQWVKDPDTGKRLRIDRPRTEWQVRQEPTLAIVERELWDAVRQRINAGRARGFKRVGGWPTTLFGGLLRCGKCGGKMISVDKAFYGCARHKESGPTACTGTRVRRKEADERLLSAIRSELATPDAIIRARASAAAALKKLGSGSRSAQERAQRLDREIANLTNAIAEEGLSQALRDRLRAAETEKAALAATAPERLPSVDDVVRHYRATLLNITASLANDLGRARSALAEALGPITIETRGEEVWATAETNPAALLVAGGGKMDVVAGARFELATFGL